jgi:transcription initiation factor IIE alpha subunit
MTHYSDQACPDCGGDLRFVDKHTFTGREFREYRCEKCGKEVVEDRGEALWQVLHDAREADAKPPAPETVAPSARPWWKFWVKT